MPLLNYTTKVNAQKTVTEVMGLLVAKGANEVSIVYDDDQQPAGLRWTVQSPRLGRVAFALPCNTEAVFVKLTEQRIMVTAQEARRQQAIRTSWRILKILGGGPDGPPGDGYGHHGRDICPICSPAGRLFTRPSLPANSGRCTHPRTEGGGVYKPAPQVSAMVAAFGNFDPFEAGS